MPDFQQFAERALERSQAWRAFVAAFRRFPGDSDSSRSHDEIADDYATAERHARLLQQVWEWAKSATARDYEVAAGVDSAKAHVRALLGEPEEPTQ